MRCVRQNSICTLTRRWDNNRQPPPHAFPQTEPRTKTARHRRTDRPTPSAHMADLPWKAPTRNAPHPTYPESGRVGHRARSASSAASHAWLLLVPAPPVLTSPSAAEVCVGLTFRAARVLVGFVWANHHVAVEAPRRFLVALDYGRFPAGGLQDVLWHGMKR